MEISDDSFVFTVGQLVSIHKRLFDGVFTHAGKLRDYNFIKKEWVLDGRSVIYGDYRELQSTLEYDFEAERRFRILNENPRLFNCRDESEPLII